MHVHVCSIQPRLSHFYHSTFIIIIAMSSNFQLSLLQDEIDRLIDHLLLDVRDLLSDIEDILNVLSPPPFDPMNTILLDDESEIGFAPMYQQHIDSMESLVGDDGFHLIYADPNFSNSSTTFVEDPDIFFVVRFSLLSFSSLLLLLLIYSDSFKNL
jgi:hypothetical protein